MSDTPTTEIVWMVFLICSQLLFGSFPSRVHGFALIIQRSQLMYVVNCSVENPGKEVREQGVYFLNNAIHTYNANPLNI